MAYQAICAALAFTVGVGVAVRPSYAQVSFSGKTINITVGTVAGGGYDAAARILARHYGRYIPGFPAIVVKNLPGAGGMRAGYAVSVVAPKDGTELFAMQNTVPLEEVLNPGKHGFNAADFTWIGSIASPSSVLAVWHTAGINNINDAKAKAVKIGATTSGSTTQQYPLLANYLLDTKFQIVSGYGIAEIDLAMERGEVDGKGASSWTNYLLQRPNWVRDQKIVPIFQVAFERDPRIPGVPTLNELTETEAHLNVARILTASEAIGRVIAGPPGMPSDVAQILRRAFDATMKDKAFLADSEQASMDVAPTTGEDMTRIVSAMMSAPRDAVEKYKIALQR